MKPLIIIVACLAFTAGFYSHKSLWNTRPAMQKMLEVHDHMQNGEVRWAWRQMYCGDAVLPLSSPIKE